MPNICGKHEFVEQVKNICENNSIGVINNVSCPKCGYLGPHASGCELEHDINKVTSETFWVVEQVVAECGKCGAEIQCQFGRHIICDEDYVETLPPELCNRN